MYYFNSPVAHFYEFDLQTFHLKTPQLQIYKSCCIIGKWMMSTNSDETSLTETGAGRTRYDVATNQTDIGGGDSCFCFVLFNIPMLWWQPPDRDNQHKKTAGHFTRFVWTGNREQIWFNQPSKSYLVQKTNSFSVLDQARATLRNTLLCVSFLISNSLQTVIQSKWFGLEN